jgi:hypothetical protein
MDSLLNRLLTRDEVKGGERGYVGEGMQLDRLSL